MTKEEYELLHRERNLQQAISCLRDRRKFASLQCIDRAIDIIADLYDMSIDEVKRMITNHAQTSGRRSRSGSGNR